MNRHFLPSPFAVAIAFAAATVPINGAAQDTAPDTVLNYN